MSDKIIPGIDIADIDMAKCWFNPGCAMSIYKGDSLKRCRPLNDNNVTANHALPHAGEREPFSCSPFLFVIPDWRDTATALSYPASSVR